MQPSFEMAKWDAVFTKEQIDALDREILTLSRLLSDLEFEVATKPPASEPDDPDGIED